MSYSYTYAIAGIARSKLETEARREDHHLRFLVGHANLLDSLLIRLDNNRLDRQLDTFTFRAGRSSGRDVERMDPVEEEREDGYGSDEDVYDMVYDQLICARYGTDDCLEYDRDDAHPHAPLHDDTPDLWMFDDDSDEDEEESEEVETPPTRPWSDWRWQSMHKQEAWRKLESQGTRTTRQTVTIVGV